MDFPPMTLTVALNHTVAVVAHVTKQLCQDTETRLAFHSASKKQLSNSSSNHPRYFFTRSELSDVWFSIHNNGVITMMVDGEIWGH